MRAEAIKFYTKTLDIKGGRISSTVSSRGECSFFSLGMLTRWGSCVDLLRGSLSWPGVVILWTVRRRAALGTPFCAPSVLCCVWPFYLLNCFYRCSSKHDVAWGTPLGHRRRLGHVLALVGYISLSSRSELVASVPSRGIFKSSLVPGSFYNGTSQDPYDE